MSCHIFFSAQCSKSHHKSSHRGPFAAEHPKRYQRYQNRFFFFFSIPKRYNEHPHPFCIKVLLLGNHFDCRKLKSHLNIISGNIEDFSCCSTCCSHCSNLLICFYLYGSRYNWGYTTFSIRWLFDVRRYVTRWRNFVA